MSDRKWENLPLRCLVNIFSRVGLASLAEDVPYVCKSWYKATLSPLCWISLIFDDLSNLKPLSENYRKLSSPVSIVEAFVKFVIRRSRRSASVVVISSDFPITKEIVNCIAEGCPSLKTLVLSCLPGGRPINISIMMCKWKNLEKLVISRMYYLEEILTQISIHCKKFKFLGVTDFRITESEASAIVSLLPNLDFLSLKGCWLKRSDLIKILKGCKKLVHLDVSDCVGFDVDEEIKRLAAHVATFNFEGSKLQFLCFRVEDMIGMAAHITPEYLEYMHECDVHEF